MPSFTVDSLYELLEETVGAEVDDEDLDDLANMSFEDIGLDSLAAFEIRKHFTANHELKLPDDLIHMKLSDVVEFINNA